MIQLTGAGKRYGPKILFENTDWLVTPQERAGIVGANGTGKSSLLKVLAGIEGLDSGEITVQKGVSIGKALENLKSQESERLHSRKLRSFAEVAFQ